MPRQPPHPWTTDEDRLLLALPRPEALARFPALKPWVVDHRRRQLRAGKVRPGERPARAGRAGALSADQRAMIRDAPAEVTNAELARRLGVSRQAVGVIRGRSQAPVRPWTGAEDEAVRTLPVAGAVERTGRTRAAVLYRRRVLGVARPARRAGPAGPA